MIYNALCWFALPVLRSICDRALWGTGSLCGSRAAHGASLERHAGISLPFPALAPKAK